MQNKMKPNMKKHPSTMDGWNFSKKCKTLSFSFHFSFLNENFSQADLIKIYFSLSFVRTITNSLRLFHLKGV